MKKQADQAVYFLVVALTLALGACATDTRTPTGAALLADVTVTPPPSPTSAVPRSTVTPPVVALTQAADRTPAAIDWVNAPPPCDKVDPRAPEMCAQTRPGPPLTPIATAEVATSPTATVTPNPCAMSVPASDTWKSHTTPDGQIALQYPANWTFAEFPHDKARWGKDYSFLILQSIPAGCPTIPLSLSRILTVKLSIEKLDRIKYPRDDDYLVAKRQDWGDNTNGLRESLEDISVGGKPAMRWTGRGTWCVFAGPRVFLEGKVIGAKAVLEDAPRRACPRCS